MYHGYFGFRCLQVQGHVWHYVSDFDIQEWHKRAKRVSHLYQSNLVIRSKWSLFKSCLRNLTSKCYSLCQQHPPTIPGLRLPWADRNCLLKPWNSQEGMNTLTCSGNYTAICSNANGFFSSITDRASGTDRCCRYLLEVTDLPFDGLSKKSAIPFHSSERLEVNCVRLLHQWCS